MRLTATEAKEYVRGGHSVQQWIGVSETDGFRFIRWVELDPTDGGWTVFYKESLDSGQLECGDITEFHNNSDPDSPEGIAYACATVDDAFTVCTDLGCAPDGFVRFCEIQLIYEQYVRDNGPAKRDAREYFVSEGSKC